PFHFGQHFVILFLTRPRMAPLSSIALLLFAYLVTASTSVCRCVFGDPCWPSEEDFAHLASQVSQPLLHPLPSGSPCYPPSDPSGNCTAVIQESTDGNWRANQSGTMQFSNFETYIFPNNTISACYLNTTIGGPCEQGSVPIIGVDARTIDDIQSAISFAALHNLRLVVKNTGHDLSGRSTTRGSFLVWTHHLKNITFHDSFQPSGAPRTETFDNAITLGAGVQWHEAPSSRWRRVRGGSVGAAGGWLLSGGHSELSPQYGLGVDNVLEIAMVTSTGDYLIANAHQHPDLFWALRGGGGGTYGIVTSVTYRTHPSLPLIGAYFIASVNSTQPTPALQAVLTEHFRLIPNLSDAGWSGGLSVFPDPTTGNLEMAMVYAFLANSSWAQANESIEPFFSFARNLASSSENSPDALTIELATTLPFDSYFSWYNRTFAAIPSESGMNQALGSWLLPRDVITDDYEKIAETLVHIRGLNYLLCAGGAVSRVDPASTGLNPAWRKALVHTIFTVAWPDGSPATVIEELEAGIAQNMTALRALAPDSGAYFNEASLVEPNPAYTFFGDHYDTLKLIKKKYDPLDLFVVTGGVGSDEWDAQLVCRR
ncbi:6-hydroxy-D-nicotine oxidase, partial [Grifola frondosa]